MGKIGVEGEGKREQWGDYCSYLPTFFFFIYLSTFLLTYPLFLPHCPLSFPPTHSSDPPTFLPTYSLTFLRGLSLLTYPLCYPSIHFSCLSVNFSSPLSTFLLHLSTFLAHLSTFLPTYLLFLPTYLPTFLPPYPLSFLPTHFCLTYSFYPILPLSIFFFL